MANPKISVITCAYNSEDFIAQAIESVLRQSYPHFEYLIIDDGSTDGTVDIIKRYALEYSRILSKGKLHHVYIDAFAGSGKHISRTTRGTIPGSPQIALDIDPPFKEYYFIDIDGAKVAELNKITANYPEAHVLQGDCNKRLLNDVFPNVEYDDYKRAFCLLDPYGLDLDWTVMHKAGQTKSIEILLNFPVMCKSSAIMAQI